MEGVTDQSWTKMSIFARALEMQRVIHFQRNYTHLIALAMLYNIYGVRKKGTIGRIFTAVSK